MAISGQEIIQIGAQNSPEGSDSLWTAFNKIQNNFTILFSESSNFKTFQAGDGIDVQSNAEVGLVTVTNTGVLNIIPGTGITTNTANGNVVISVTPDANGNIVMGVTNVNVTSSTLNIVGSPIVSQGTISVDLPTQQTVSPGTYNNPTILVDQYGRISNITSNEISGTVTSVALEGGAGIAISDGPITTDGTITVTNIGVTKLTAGIGIALTSETGEITISSTSFSGGPTGLGASGSNNQVQFNIDGLLNASANFTFDPSTNLLTVNNISITDTVEFGDASSVHLGDIGNIFIDGGDNGYVLQTDGSGNLSWVAQSGAGNGSPGGANTQIQFNDSGLFNGSANFTFDQNTNNLVLVGNILASYFEGDGSGLSSINGANVIGDTLGANYANYSGTSYSVDGANVSGTVANANYATYAGTAYSVSGANIVGSVANANYTLVAEVAYSIDGGNVVGEVANANYTYFAGVSYNVDAGNVYGTVANANYAAYSGESYSITGSNVVGEVANANYSMFAGTAYSVDSANIVGEVTNANYANYAGTAYNVDAANISGTITFATESSFSNEAYSIDGANVNGEVANANFAGYSNVVIASDQPNITSVGTLTDLTVSGNILGNNIQAAGAVVLPTYISNAARDSAITSPTPGMLVYNSDIFKFQGYDGLNWVDLN